MGREIRRVPHDWEHPKTEQQRWNGKVLAYAPLHDQVFEDVARKWLDNAIAWDKGNDPHKAEYPFFWQWDGMPPDPKYYRPKWTSEPTHYQMYETVSEGTPVTPHFATKEELVEYLVRHGEFGDSEPWGREAAEAFVKEEWAPSLVITGGRVYRPRDGMPK